MKIFKSIFLIFAMLSIVAVSTSSFFTSRDTIDNNQIMAGTFPTPTPSPSVSANVRICHATGQEGNYQDISPSAEGVINGHVGASHQGGGDIIPPFYYGEPIQYFPGQNWDAEGQAIWNNNCEIPKSPTPTPSESSLIPE